MEKYYITFRSVTTAQRGERCLHRGGVECRILRTPRWMEERGCGYCLRLRPGELHKSLELLKGEGIAYSKIYLQDGGGGVTLWTP